jgi:hypothetical protein
LLLPIQKMVAKAPTSTLMGMRTIPTLALQQAQMHSMDKRDVEAMLLAEQEQADRSMQYDDNEQYHQHQYGEEDIESEEDFGFIQPEWPHVLTVDDVRSRRTKALRTSEEVRSSVGSRSQASQFSPGAGSVGSIPPVLLIPSMFRHDTTEDPRQSSVAMSLGPSPPGRIRSSHSRAGTDPGPQQPRLASPVKWISASSSSLDVRERITVFDRGASPAPGALGLVHGARSGSPTRTHGLGLGLGLSLTRSPAPASMLSTPFSPAQSMPPMSPPAVSTGARFEEPRSISYQSSLSSHDLDRLVPSNLLNPINLRKVRELFKINNNNSLIKY